MSIENNKYSNRANMLRATPAVIKFISFEPLIGSVDEVSLHGINWVIVGGETGGHARAMQEHWIDYIYGKCIENTIPFLFKQWGVHKPKNYNKIYRGERHSSMPAFIPNPEKKTITKGDGQECAKTMTLF